MKPVKKSEADFRDDSSSISWTSQSDQSGFELVPKNRVVKRRESLPKHMLMKYRDAGFFDLPEIHQNNRPIW